jgi:hypothetical protein
MAAHLLHPGNEQFIRGEIARPYLSNNCPRIWGQVGGLVCLLLAAFFFYHAYETYRFRDLLGTENVAETEATIVRARSRKGSHTLEVEFPVRNQDRLEVVKKSVSVNSRTYHKYGYNNRAPVFYYRADPNVFSVGERIPDLPMFEVVMTFVMFGLGIAGFVWGELAQRKLETLLREGKLVPAMLTSWEVVSQFRRSAIQVGLLLTTPQGIERRVSKMLPAFSFGSTLSPADGVTMMVLYVDSDNFEIL